MIGILAHLRRLTKYRGGGKREHKKYNRCTEAHEGIWRLSYDYGFTDIIYVPDE